MTIVGVRDLKTHLSGWIERARSGEQVIVSVHGRPVAALVPLTEDFLQVQAMIEAGMAQWSGEKPELADALVLVEGSTAQMILEDRGDPLP